MKLRKFTALLLALLTAAAVLTGCDTAADSGADTVLGSGGKTLRIVSGSENRELEPILEDFAKSEGVRIEMTYQGSLDIMRLLEGEELPYDAVWPASSLWLDAADTSLNLKHAESVSITPVVFGIRQSLAQELGLVGKDVSVGDLLEPIRGGKLRFCMTSATQSNSGASAYIGFLYALLGNPETITSADLESERLRTQMTELLSGVDRSSGSSDWLKDMFLQGDFDAMVNYECLVIQANQELEAQGREPLYVVYPTDGLTIADSPLAYVDQGDGEKEELFLKLQEYLLSDEIQSAIQRTGRRSSYTGVNEENRDVFREDWGLQPDRVLSPMKMPAQEVLFQALDLYQTEFKKPSLNVYCLDYSGSMAGEGNRQLEAAMEQLLIQSNAREHFLQASSREVNILIPFSGEPMEVCTARGNGAGAGSPEHHRAGPGARGRHRYVRRRPPGAGGTEELRPVPVHPGPYPADRRPVRGLVPNVCRCLPGAGGPGAGVFHHVRGCGREPAGGPGGAHQCESFRRPGGPGGGLPQRKGV